ncbi:MAG: Na(+)/H(+) antiporter subunit B [Hyphomicrobiales bacterium]
MPALALDVILAASICAVALGAVLARELLAAIVFFIVYGALLSIAWVRLGSVDVALAEAAIGAGLTGILLIGAAARLRPAVAHSDTFARLVPFALCVGLVAMLLVALHGLAHETAGLAPLIEDNLAASGVSNPVTAVLLNFRGYDTLLETVVLVIALVAVWSVTSARFWGGTPGLRQHARADGVLAHFGRLLPAVGILVAVHLLWSGSHAPGGAFQAGTVLAAVWLLVAMAGLTDAPAVSDRRLRITVAGGPLVFLLVAGAGALAGTFLGLPSEIAYYLILAIEVALTVSIAATLAMLVLGVPRRTP